jgi:hypothetical protein
MNRKQFLYSILGTSLAAACGSAQAETKMIVYKTSTCGCCGNWVEHLKANGFEVDVREVNDIVTEGRRLGVPDNLRSCHTGSIGGYAIEGHVPAADIKRLLAEQPQAKGLAVPGMPVGSPGMENGSYVERYSVLLFNADGTNEVYSNYGG